MLMNLQMNLWTLMPLEGWQINLGREEANNNLKKCESFKLKIFANKLIERTSVKWLFNHDICLWIQIQSILK